MTGSSKDKGHKGMYCNDNPIGRGVSQNCTVTPLSNWSVVEEIKRLIEINSIKMLSQIINFIKKFARKKNQPHSMSRSNFTKGKSRGKSQRYQCKACKSSLMFYQKRRNHYLSPTKEHHSSNVR